MRWKNEEAQGPLCDGGIRADLINKCRVAIYLLIGVAVEKSNGSRPCWGRVVAKCSDKRPYGARDPTTTYSAQIHNPTTLIVFGLRLFGKRSFNMIYSFTFSFLLMFNLTAFTSSFVKSQMANVMNIKEEQ